MESFLNKLVKTESIYFLKCAMDELDRDCEHIITPVQEHSSNPQHTNDGNDDSDRYLRVH